MDIDRMKRKRAVVRTSTTKLLNDIATMEDDASLGELEEKINLLTLKEDSLKELDREIEIGVEDDALEEEIACSENYKEKINVARTKVQLMLQQYAETANILRSHLYVDDLVTGVDTLEQGKVLCQESSDILSQAGMRLHKWMSNDHDLVNFIEDGNVAKRNANAELPAATKVLGVGWNAHTDNFEYNLTSLLEFLTTRADSKRFVLQVSARIFDPFGFIAPTTLYVKTMFQRLWELGSGLGRPLARIDASGVEVLV
ncbi:hypothetical protein MRX96_050163 [Rhipicephalus microplus]